MLPLSGACAPGRDCVHGRTHSVSRREATHSGVGRARHATISAPKCLRLGAVTGATTSRPATVQCCPLFSGRPWSPAGRNRPPPHYCASARWQIFWDDDPVGAGTPFVTVNGTTINITALPENDAVIDTRSVTLPYNFTAIATYTNKVRVLPRARPSLVDASTRLHGACAQQVPAPGPDTPVLLAQLWLIELHTTTSGFACGGIMDSATPTLNKRTHPPTGLGRCKGVDPDHCERHLWHCCCSCT